MQSCWKTPQPPELPTGRGSSALPGRPIGQPIQRTGSKEMSRMPVTGLLAKGCPKSRRAARTRPSAPVVPGAPTITRPVHSHGSQGEVTLVCRVKRPTRAHTCTQTHTRHTHTRAHRRAHTDTMPARIYIIKRCMDVPLNT